ncbi:MAG: hypothetical protein KAJ19_24255 [Gammaproteobacteria bacterium]|nr:hypothetical protein [Gammaproteobacteria bacterium]
MIILTCDNCGRRVERYPSQFFPDRHTFCENSCFREFQSKPLVNDEILEFLVSYVLANGGMAPTYREIIADCEVASTSHVQYVLKRLAEAGLIVLLGSGKSRAIRIVGMKLTYTDPRSCDDNSQPEKSNLQEFQRQDQDPQSW